MFAGVAVVERRITVVAVAVVVMAVSNQAVYVAGTVVEGFQNSIMAVVKYYRLVVFFVIDHLCSMVERLSFVEFAVVAHRSSFVGYCNFVLFFLEHFQMIEMVVLVLEKDY